MIVLFITLLTAEKLGVLSEIVQPSAMEVGKGRLYVVQGSRFFVYSLTDLKLIKTFGTVGEGPGELKKSPLLPNSVRILDNRIIAEGISKIIFFSKDFQHLKDVKKPRMMFTMLPVKKHFLALQFLPDRQDKIFLTVTLFDEKMNTMKELHRQDTVDKDKEIIMLRDTIHFSVFEDKIYVERSDRGFNIGVFDSQGTFLYEISHNFKPQKLTKQDKNTIFNHFKRDKLIQTIAKSSGGW